ncbi:MAG: response regulator [Treponema sp.]|nr:response regulator [Treponema sp.]
MEMANITCHDFDGSIKVKVDHTKCIACGRCLSACKHNARYYHDDTESFFNDLPKGIPISLIVAPSIRTNIPAYKRLFTYLKKLGVRHIYDVSLGADICIWAHVRYIEQGGSAPLITQPCPAIVTYCELYRPDLLPSLSPIQGPMACASIYMKEYKGINDRIAALSPCVAKANEFEDTGLAQYNVTFAQMIEYLEKNNIELPSEKTGFDHIEGGLGSLFPMPGGLKENIEFFMGKKIHISKAEGFNVYTKLNAYAETPAELLPEVFDVLNCIEGCNIGPACSHRRNVFEIDKTMKNNRKNVTENHTREHFEAVYKAYDETFDISRFMRKYQPAHIPFPKITDEDIQNAFSLLGKDDHVRQSINCGACGSDSCYNMARKIALGVNIPSNCIVKTMENAKEEHTLNLSMLEQFETVWKNVESSIIVIDAETLIVLDVNPAAARLFGASKEDMTGKQCQNVFCPAKQCQCLFRTQDQPMDRCKREFVKSDGTIIPIVKSVSKIHYNGRPALLESFSDISYLKKAEEQKHMLEIAEQANKAKSAFLANMSHEIRTPMNAIIGMTSIGMSTADTDRKNYCFNRIDDASKHLLGIINDILDMSKIEAGKLELSPAEFNFEKMLQRVVNVNNVRISEKNQKFTVHIDKAIPKTLFGDEQRLAQVITNLVGNAVKFTPEKGSISINTQFLGEENGLCTIQFSVTDSGIGISDDQQKRLFQSFQQAESSTARRFGGTGLGLAISKSIVDMMGGRIWIESELGKGATFAFTIQAKRMEEKQKKLPDLSSIRILAVDDDPAILEYLSEIMQGFGGSCATASTGEEALQLIEQNGLYDIYFVDWRLPGIDGMELTEALKAKKKNSGKGSVVMMSSAEWSLIEKDATKAGVDKFLFKPFFPSNIADIICECIGVDYQQTEDEHQNIFNFEGYSVLLAEDIEINREIVQTLLEPMNLTIDCAENGSEAVRLFTEYPEKYDMIFMDVQMPEMDGYEAARRIRAFEAEHSVQLSERPKGVPIIAMTANVFREDIQKCLEAGMNNHVGKPLNFEDVLDKLRTYLPHTGTMRQEAKK